MIFLISVFLLQPFTSIVYAAEWCNPWLNVGDDCKISVLDLSPTQIPYGKLAMQVKREKILNFSVPDFNDELKKFLKNHEVPIVIGPGDMYYMLDHHHLCKAVYLVMGSEQKVYARVKHNWSDDTQAVFLKKMNDKGYFYLKDENGKDSAISKLPKTVHGLKDDVYRSLAYFVREAGGFHDSSKLFSEFEWAQFFRKKIPNITNANVQKKETLKTALRLARSSEAQTLPGYISGTTRCTNKLIRRLDN